MSPAPATLLLVDDEPSILNALRRTLSKQDLRILTTSEPTDVLSILQREKVDLLISDIDMPRLNGIELVAAVRREHPDVVRMLLTGRGSFDSAVHAINDGQVHRYLTKPWNNDELIAAVHDALARRDELRRVAAAERDAARHQRLLLELEAEHPGITTRTLRDGSYLLNEAELDTFALRLPSAVRDALGATPMVLGPTAPNVPGTTQSRFLTPRTLLAGAVLLGLFFSLFHLF